MKPRLRLILPLFLLWVITACSAPADKEMLKYEQTLARADSLVQSGTADSARTACLLAGLHREYVRAKEQSAGKPLRLMPATGWKRFLWGALGTLMLGLNVWLSIRDIKFTSDRKHRRYLVDLSENERRLRNNEYERVELEECLREMSLEDDEREEVHRSLTNLMEHGSRLHGENELLRVRLKEYESRAMPPELEQLKEQSERVRQLDGQVRALTASLIDGDEMINGLRRQPKFLTDAQWDYLHELADRVYGNFTARLATRFPQLTPADLQLCLLIRLRFTNAQTATFMAVSPASVSQQKFRLKKRMMQGDETLFAGGQTVDMLVCEC